ncbi:relaxase/mobilization nuclease domain-containing protein [Chitinophaga pinensis]|uniref:MobA/VirD2-like nuclease domain-containing protein n=1 Tax=Chitinophaga pinensis (strain ATCC 43595 / DSM 2588 / LMG 13176 / NBRC 15968 / NCIMB 11800 / UQM 2034) TaxID=485918 RepID=A0A979GA42_CHIPD|nr:relaxase/mobilization nuclease domain-containing protein [Chitinophaga pinensis]ACU63729.1 hypothetical protein Cpin_6324 [Chitinophaga pinensis DSM 2588]
MIVKGRIRGNGGQLASYLLRKGENDTVRLFDIRGTSHLYDLRKSLLEMSFTSELTRTDKGLYHVQINPRPGEDKKMTADDWLRAAEIMEEETGFKGQKRIMVMHEKKGRIHMHVAWERYSHGTGKMISNKYSRYAQDRARKRMENEFSQNRTPDKNIERPELNKLLAELWALHPSGKAFIKAVGQYGYTVCRSEGRRPMVIINKAGRSFDLVRETKVKTKDMRERLKGLQLPHDKQVIASIRERQQNDTKETPREKRIRELKEQMEQHEKAKDKQQGR